MPCLSLLTCIVCWRRHGRTGKDLGVPSDEDVEEGHEVHDEKSGGPWYASNESNPPASQCSYALASMCSVPARALFQRRCFVRRPMVPRESQPVPGAGPEPEVRQAYKPPLRGRLASLFSSIDASRAHQVMLLRCRRFHYRPVYDFVSGGYKYKCLTTGIMYDSCPFADEHNVKLLNERLSAFTKRELMKRKFEKVCMCAVYMYIYTCVAPSHPSHAHTRFRTDAHVDVHMRVYAGPDVCGPATAGWVTGGGRRI